MTWFSCIFTGKRTSRQQTVQGDEVISGLQNVKIYSYNELRRATRNYSADNRIGIGGFASVYKGTLEDGTVIAIKVFHNRSLQGQQLFLNEITTINNLVHENLVRLYGCCVEGDHRMLVYQYLMNGSVGQALLGGNQNIIQFNWRRRTRICVGIARGLAFLHEEVQPNIIHRDIKADNILLDGDLTPKISGFELSMLIPEDATHISTNIAGTVGYLAPDYCMTGIVRPASDVYSFGVLLLEIISGRRINRVGPPYEEQDLCSVVWELYEHEELESIIDPTLTDDLDIEEACKILKIGLLCTQDAFNLRPLMSKVVQMLIGERDVISERITRHAIISPFVDGDIGSENDDFFGDSPFSPRD